MKAMLNGKHQTNDPTRLAYTTIKTACREEGRHFSHWLRRGTIAIVSCQMMHCDAVHMRMSHVSLVQPDV